MLKSVVGRTLNIMCNGCQKPYDYTIPDDKVCRWVDEFKEYENLVIQCPNCGNYEVFVMNIPVNDTDEPFKTGDLPTEEEIQRYYVRYVQRLVREDLIG